MNASGSYQIGGKNAIGEDAAHFNLFVGSGAGASTTTGQDNTSSGFNALNSNTTGTYNTASGFEALKANDTGLYNTASGFGALLNNTAGGGNTASGAQALQTNTMGKYNTASGFNALAANVTGDFNTASGLDALSNNRTGNYLTALGRDADVGSDGLTNATAIGAGAKVNESNALVLGSSGVKVGIGTSTPAHALDVVGDGNFTGAVSSGSDRHSKENIHPVNVQAVLRRLAALPISSWSYKADPKATHVGPMAQDLYAAFHPGDDNRHIASVDSEGLALAAIKALAKLDQQQAGRITTQQRQSISQQRQIAFQQRQLAAQQREIQQIMQWLNHMEGRHSHL